MQAPQPVHTWALAAEKANLDPGMTTARLTAPSRDANARELPFFRREDRSLEARMLDCRLEITDQKSRNTRLSTRVRARGEKGVPEHPQRVVSPPSPPERVISGPTASLRHKHVTENKSRAWTIPCARPRGGCMARQGRRSPPGARASRPPRPWAHQRRSCAGSWACCPCR